MATFEQWLEALQPVYDLSPKRASELTCPNCGAKALQLRFVTYVPEGRAFIAFWCDKCLEGLAPGPCTVPAAYHPVRPEDANIPNYRCPPPSGHGGNGSGA
jgi:hypothetical protein